MKIRWTKDVTLTIYTSDKRGTKDGKGYDYTEQVKKGETDNIYIFNSIRDFIEKMRKNHTTVDIQFGNGGCAYNVSIDWFEVL